MHYCPSIALLVAIAPPLVAQEMPTGSVTLKMSVTVPDSIKAAAAVGRNIDMRMTIATDGRRLAMVVLPSTGQPMTDGMEFRIIYTFGGDSVQVGVLLPPAMAAVPGGSPGMRMDMPLSMLGAGSPLLGTMMDSIGKKMTDSLGRPLAAPTFRSLGTSASVAGVTCQEWEVVGMGDTTRTCVIPTPPTLIALQERLLATTGLRGMMAQIPGLANIEQSAYGGRKMTAIRTTTVKSGLHVELVSYSTSIPDEATFTLPADLKPTPMPVMPGKPGGR